MFYYRDKTRVQLFYFDSNTTALYLNYDITIIAAMLFRSILRIKFPCDLNKKLPGQDETRPYLFIRL